MFVLVYLMDSMNHFEEEVPIVLMGNPPNRANYIAVVMGNESIILMIPNIANPIIKLETPTARL